MKGRLPLARGLFQLYAAEIVAKILGFLAFARLGKVLGPGPYGDLEFAFGVAFLLWLVMDAGIGPYAARRATLDPSGLPLLVAQVAVLRTALLIIALGLLAVLILLVPRPDARHLARMAALGLLAAPWTFPFVFQARREMHWVALSNLLRQSVQALIVFTAVETPSDAGFAIVGDAAGLGLVACLHQALVRRRLGVIPWGAGLSGLMGLARASAPFAASTLAWAVRWFAPLILLGLLPSGEEAGLLGAGHRLIVSVHAFVWLWFFNLLPALAKADADRNRQRFRSLLSTSLHLSGWIAFVGAVGTASIGPWLMPWIYGDAFASAGFAFQWMILALATAFISGHWRFGLLAKGDAKGDFRANVAGAMTSVVLSCVAMAQGSATMAGAALFVAEVVTALVASRQRAIRSEVKAPVALFRPALGASASAFCAFGIPALKLPILKFLLFLVLSGVFAAVTEPRLRALLWRRRSVPGTSPRR